MRQSSSYLLLLLVLLTLIGCASSPRDTGEDRYAEFVWPAPPDEPRIKLVDVLSGRVDVEGKSKFRKTLIGAGPQNPLDNLSKPFGVAFDGQGRILVTDSATSAIIRFDKEGGRYDVLGTQGSVTLKLPLGITVAPDETIYVADAGLRKIVRYEPDGKVAGIFGREGDLQNPTDAELSPDLTKLYVPDSKAHKIVVFDLATGDIVSSFGKRGSGEGQFNFPTSVAFSPEGSLYVVDQLNSRIQVFAPDGEYQDEFGDRGVGFGNLVRPKDVTIDEVGFIYVTDNAFNNVQIFDIDLTLLTFVGEGGTGPGRFHGASGVAVQGQRFAVVDQLAGRVQVFEFIGPKDEVPPPFQVAEVTRPAPAEEEESSLPEAVRKAAEELQAPDPEPAAEEVAETSPPRAREQIPAADPSSKPEPDTAPAEAIQRQAAIEPETPEPEEVVHEQSVSREPVDSAQEEIAESAGDLPAPETPIERQIEPEITAPAVQPDVPATEEQIRSAIETWRSAWTAQDVDTYLAAYSPTFSPTGPISRATWESRRRGRLTQPAFIEVTLEALRIDVSSETRAQADLIQTFRSDAYADRVRKRLNLELSDGIWLITEENSIERLPMQASPTKRAMPPTAMPPTATPAPPATSSPNPVPYAGPDRIDEISWAEDGTTTVITIRATGLFAADSYRVVRLDSPPRGLIQLKGVSTPYSGPRIEVGSSRVRSIRTGHHTESGTPELHIVIDLTDSAFEIQRVEPTGNELVIHIG